MPGASDFMVGNAPGGANYAAPLVGFGIGDRLADLPNQYFKGTQQARTLAMQQPVIDPNTGQPTTDPRAILAAANQRGGLEAALQTMNLQQRQQFLDWLNSDQQGTPTSSAAAPPQPNYPAPSNTPAAGPGHILGPRATNAANQQPDIGDQNTGANTVQGIATEVFGGRDVSAMIPRYAAALGVKIDDPLSPQQIKTARAYMARTAQNGSSDVSGSAAAPLPGGGASGAGAPPPGNAPETASASAGIRPSVQPTISPASTLVPGSSQNDPEMQEAQRQDALADRYARAAQGGEALFGLDAKGLLEQAAAARKKAQDIRDARVKAGQATLESQLRSGEPTDTIKQYNVYKSQGGNLPFDQWEPQHEGSVQAAKDDANTVADIAKDGVEAKGQIGQLNAIQQLGEKVGYGTAPKLQSFLGKYGINSAGLSDIQAYERAIDYMAPQLRPIGSGKLLNTELLAFKASLGGLMTTPQGREISVTNLGLIARYKTQIGEIAADSKLTPTERLSKIYQLPPPQLVTQAPGQQQPAKGQPTPAATPGNQFNSPADAVAARNAGKIQSGHVFTTPQGSYRVP
jgi:hypothetical protein